MEIVSDDEVLRAALDFVDEFIARDDGIMSTEDANACARGPSPSKRVRTELIRLRVEADALHLQLSSLKRSIQSTAQRADTVVLSAWRALASRQKTRRRQAEAENSELRALLLEQARTVRRLEKLIRKRCWEQTKKPRSIFHGIASSSLLPPTHVTIDRDELLKQLQHMYAQIYTIFGAPRFVVMAGEPEPVRNLVTRDDQQMGRTVEMLESRVYPYAYGVISKAVWHPLTRFAVPGDDCTGRKFGTTTDTSIDLEVSFESGPPMTPEQGVLRSKVVGRRMMERGVADVVVWTMALDAKFSKERFSSIEKLWMLIRPLGEDASTSGAIVQVFVQSTRTQRGFKGLARCTYDGSNDALGDYESCLRAHMDDFWASVEALLLDKNWQSRNKN